MSPHITKPDTRQRYRRSTSPMHSTWPDAPAIVLQILFVGEGPWSCPMPPPSKTRRPAKKRRPPHRAIVHPFCEFSLLWQARHLLELELANLGERGQRHAGRDCSGRGSSRDQFGRANSITHLNRGLVTVSHSIASIAILTDETLTRSVRLSLLLSL